MKQLFTSRIPAVAAALLFAAATFMTAGAERENAPTSMTLSLPGQASENIASAR